jgi:hypothetical protein
MVEISGLAIKYEGPVPGSVNLRARTWRRLQKWCWQETGRYWHEHFREKHFTHRGATEYGYTKRDPEYERRKFHEHGHTYPLVLTGESKERTEREDVRATFRKVRVVLHAPTLSFIPAGSEVKMSEEIRTISEREAKELTKVWDTRMERQLRRIKKRTVKKLG